LKLRGEEDISVFCTSGKLSPHTISETVFRENKYGKLKYNKITYFVV